MIMKPDVTIMVNVQVGTEGTPKSPGDESKTAILAHPFKVTSNCDDGDNHNDWSFGRGSGG